MSNCKLFVGNLPWSTDEEALQAMFGRCGGVTSVKLITDRETGKSRGFGFVEMEDEAGAQAAIREFNGSRELGRDLVVNIARPIDRSAPRR